jgi:large subunit ribosomal protein L21
MYAVVTTGGKQYRVEAGSELVIEKLAADAGASVTFDRVLLVGDGDAVTIGTPTVEGASVSGTVLREELGPKLIIFKFKQKATYRRTMGHRQHLVRVRIDEISSGGKRARADKADKVDKVDKVEAKAPEKAKAEAPEKTAPANGAKKQARARKPAAAKADAADAAAKPAPRRRSPAKSAESKE